MDDGLALPNLRSIRRSQTRDLLSGKVVAGPRVDYRAVGGEGSDQW